MVLKEVGKPAMSRVCGLGGWAKGKHKTKNFGTKGDAFSLR